jgi:phage repressor protein C with HTH and peptisase S24 domain
MLSQVLQRVEKRLKATGLSAAAASKAAGLSEDAIRNMKRAEAKEGRAGVSTRTLAALAQVLGTTSGWLMDGTGPEESAGEPMTPLLGLVGANAASTVMYSTGDPTNSSVPALSWAPEAVAVQVVGDSCGEIYPDGSILWFEQQDTPPSPDMIGEIVVADTEDGHVLVKRLERGEKKGLYDLKSVIGETLRGQRLKWAARILASVKPPTSRRLIRHASERSA